MEGVFPEGNNRHIKRTVQKGATRKHVQGDIDELRANLVELGAAVRCLRNVGQRVEAEALRRGGQSRVNIGKWEDGGDAYMYV